MGLFQFIKNVSATYFAEMDKVWQSSKRCWHFIFIGFLLIYALQVHGAYVNYPAVAAKFGGIDPNEWWNAQVKAMYIQGIVLLGIFIKYLSAHYRGKWAVRFGELGEFIAFASFLYHLNWVLEKYPDFHIGKRGASQFLTGVPFIFGDLIILFFIGWVTYKIAFAIAVTLKTVRK